MFNKLTKTVRMTVHSVCLEEYKVVGARYFEEFQLFHKKYTYIYFYIGTSNLLFGPIRG